MERLLLWYNSTLSLHCDLQQPDIDFQFRPLQYLLYDVYDDDAPPRR